MVNFIISNTNQSYTNCISGTSLLSPSGYKHSDNTINVVNIPLKHKSSENMEIVNELVIKKTHKKMSLEEKFWNFTDNKDNDKCWSWTGLKDKNGYGLLYHDNKQERAHRISYMIHKGPITKGKDVLHTCDNPSCVNSNHLYEGTPEDNAKDRENRNRGNHPKGEKLNQPKGETHPSSKTNWNVVNEIRKGYSNGGISERKLSNKYGLSRGAIKHIINNVSWKDISYKPPSEIKKENQMSNVKSTLKEINVIREKYKNGLSINKISKEHNMSWQNIKFIVTNTTWKNNEYQKWLDNKNR